MSSNRSYLKLLKRRRELLGDNAHSWRLIEQNLREIDEIRMALVELRRFAEGDELKLIDEALAQS